AQSGRHAYDYLLRRQPHDRDGEDEARRRRTQLGQDPLQPPTSRLAHHSVGDPVVLLVDVALDLPGIAPGGEIQVVVPIDKLRKVPAGLPDAHALRLPALWGPARRAR